MNLLVISINLVREAVLRDFRTIEEISYGESINRYITVSGQRIRYTVFRRQVNGKDIYNVGRIHEAN